MKEEVEYGKDLNENVCLEWWELPQNRTKNFMKLNKQEYCKTYCLYGELGSVCVSNENYKFGDK